MGALGLLTPWMLLAFAVLPAIWLLLRLTPPKPRRVDFPPTRILVGLDEREKTPARTPWWLTALRLLLAALLIAALAGPILRPETRLVAGEAPLLVVLDNGWDTSPDFDARIAAAETALREARDAGRPVALAATAEPAEGLEPGDFAQASERLAAIAPRPYLPDRAAFARRLETAYRDIPAEILWIAGKVDGGGAAALADAMGRVSARATYLASARPLTAMLPPINGAHAVTVPLRRLGAAGTVAIAGFDAEGRRIVEGEAAFDGEGDAEVEIALPTEIRNALSRFSVAEENSAGAVQLLDGSWRRKAVGLIAGEGSGAAQPLLEPLTYVQRALAPFADLMSSAAATTSDAIAELLRRGASVIVLTETGNLAPETGQALSAWVEAGGTLVRFASPNVSASSETGLLPLRLRQGERELGGSLSWEQPQAIGGFSKDGPFADIAPPQDVRVNRQVLADPAALGQVAVWAELADGTPLVTARDSGRGRIVLFHVTADPRWSNLPLSGAFVEMLESIVSTAGTVEPARSSPGSSANASGTPAPAAATPWQPVEVLDGYGRLGRPAPTARMIADLTAAIPGADTPPGYYDRDGTVRAFNAVRSGDALTPLDAASIGWGGGVASLEPRATTPIWPWILAAACALAIADAIAVLFLSGRLATLRTRAAMLLFAAMLAAPVPRPAEAQEAGAGAGPDQAIESALSTRLAYVSTGDREIDTTSLEGLRGLSTYLAQRTALEPGEPIGLDLARDELVFYALIYWPIDPAADLPSAETMAKVDSFMKNGGTILFDTRDAGGFAPPGSPMTQETARLREILSFIDVPPLEPVPPDHVLGKAFFLLTEFPGRWNRSELWVESLGESGGDPTRPVRGGDGVSPVLITGNDFASAWAIDEQNRFVYPTVPADPRQRELAFRSGVNIVMYALTGNYKADQVHIPALLERLGQ